MEARKAWIEESNCRRLGMLLRLEWLQLTRHVNAIIYIFRIIFIFLAMEFYLVCISASLQPNWISRMISIFKVYAFIFFEFVRADWLLLPQFRHSNLLLFAKEPFKLTSHAINLITFAPVCKPSFRWLYTFLEFFPPIIEFACDLFENSKKLVSWKGLPSDRYKDLALTF